MRQIQRLVQDIRSSLIGGPTEQPESALATSYARWRMEASRRLDACAEMISKGSDYQALQLAETDPPILDLVETLSFAEEKTWRERCLAQGVTSLELFNVKSLELVRELYAKGISPNSPLYKDYRAASSARDDAQALRIMRTIAKLNPSDQNAAKEIGRLEHKLALAHMAELEKAILREDREAISHLVTEIETFPLDEKLRQRGEYLQGIEVRTHYLREQAQSESAQHLATLHRLHKDGQWKEMRAITAQIYQLLQDHQFALLPEQKLQLQGEEEYIRENTKEAAQQGQHEETLQRLLKFSQAWTARSTTGDTIQNSEAESSAEKLAQLWTETTASQRVIPENVKQQVDQTRQSIQSIISRNRQARKIRSTLLWGTATVVALSIAALIARQAQVSSAIRQLGSAQADKQFNTANQLAAKFKEPSLLRINSSAALQQKIKETQQWIATEESQAFKLRQQIATLSAQAESHFSGTDTKTLYLAVEDAGKQLAVLPPDLAEQMPVHLTKVRSAMEQHFANQAAKQEVEQKEQLAAAAATANTLALSKPISDYLPALESILPVLTKVENEAAHPAAALHPSAELQAAAKALRDQITPFETEATAYTSARKKMEASETGSQYQSALTELTKLVAKDGGDAQKIEKSFATENLLLAHLLFQGNAAAWEAVQTDTKATDSPRPDNVLPEEIALLLELRDDSFLNSIWEITTEVLPGKNKRTYWSIGKPTASKTGMRTLQHGSFYLPDAQTGTVVSFTTTPLEFLSFDNGQSSGVSVTASNPSSTQTFMQKLDLRQMTDVNGKQYQRSLFDLFDMIRQEENVPVLARAYLMSKLGKILRLRPQAWGAHYSPSLLADLERLDHLLLAVPLSSKDWMAPASSSAQGTQARDFFKSIAGRDYKKETQAFRKLALKLRDGQTIFSGFVDSSLAPWLSPKAPMAREAWVSPAAHQSVAQLTMEDGELSEKEIAEKGLRWAPIYVISTDRKDAVEEFRHDVTSFTVDTTAIPYLATPLP